MNGTDSLDSQALSAHNRSLVLNALKDRPRSRAQVGRITGLSAPSVTRLMKGLVDEGAVIELDEHTQGPGRPARLLGRNPRAGALAGIDFLGPTHGHWVLADAVGTTLDSGLFEASTRVGTEGLVATALSRVRQAGLEAGLPCRAIAAAVPGIVNPNNGYVTEAPNLHWRNVDLGAILVGSVDDGVAVAVENDVRIQAYAHRHRTLDANVRDFVVLRLDEGVGSAVVVDDVILRGRHWAAGEIGFIPTGVDNLHGSAPGGRGPLERQLSADGILARYRSRVGPEADGCTAIDVLDRAGTDADADAVVGETLRLLLIAATALTSVVDPQCIVFDGAIALRLAGLADKITEGLASVFLEPPEVVLSELGPMATALGAVQLAELLTLGTVAGPIRPTSITGFGAWL